MKYIEKLEKQEACPESLNWLKENNFKTKQAAWDACPRADWMLWAWSHNVVQNSKNHKQLVLACCACARTSLKFIKDKKLKKAVEKCLETTEGWTRNENSLEEVKAARNAAYDFAAYYAAAYYAASAAADAADYYAAYYAANAAADREAALKEMSDMIRKIQPKCPKFLKKD